VDRNGQCKLSDFGESNIITKEFNYKNEDIKGIQNFVAPESVKKNEYTRYSDIWSLGCLVIEMITGCPPYPEFKNPVSILYHISHASNPPIIPSEFNISKELEDFLDCCLKINPNERMNVNELLRHPFTTGDIIVKMESNDNNNNNHDNNNSNIIYDLTKFNSKGFQAFNNNKNIYNNNINQISVINNDNDNSNNNFLKNSNEIEDFSYMEFMNKHKESEINEG